MAEQIRYEIIVPIADFDTIEPWLLKAFEAAQGVGFDEQHLKTAYCQQGNHQWWAFRGNVEPSLEAELLEMQAKFEDRWLSVQDFAAARFFRGFGQIDWIMDASAGVTRETPWTAGDWFAKKRDIFGSPPPVPCD
jgi:hypothetical protein